MSESPLNVPAGEELSNALKAATDPEAIRMALTAEFQKQTADKAAADAEAKAAADKEAADKAAADAAVVEPETFTRTETIGGREFTFEAESELELERAVANAYRVAEALQENQPTVVDDPAKEAADAAAAAKAAEEHAAAQVELELKFKRGEITANDYIEQSGAIKNYLEKEGVPLDELKSTIETGRNKGFEQSWALATEAFLHSEAGADWPGGDNNRDLIGMKIAALNLVDAEDKTVALAQAWASMKASKMYFPAEAAASTTPAAPAAATPVAASAAPAAPAAAPAAPKAAPTSSSLFGASSGSGGAGTAETTVKDKVEMAKDASPAEIIAAYKEGLLRDGKDPNAAFVEAFASRRA